MLHACLAPGVDPGRVRLVRIGDASGGTAPDLLASLTPAEALALADTLRVAARALLPAQRGPPDYLDRDFGHR